MFFNILSWALIVSGSSFLLIGSIGLIRLPDVFARMHAAGIVATLAVSLLVIGMGILAAPEKDWEKQIFRPVNLAPNSLLSPARPRHLLKREVKLYPKFFSFYQWLGCNCIKSKNRMII